ncbi:MAG: extracellular solute-binding protein, partial [Pseudomonas sp.]
MNNNHKRLLITLGLLLGAAVTTAQAEDKTLRLYNWADYFAEDTLAKFTAETGIKVIYDVMDGSEVLEAKLMTGGSGYDLIFPGDTVAERLMGAGSLMPLDQSKLTELADIEPGLQKLRSHYEHSSKATVPYTWGTIGLTYNDEQIRQRLADAPVNSLDLLFKPEIAAKFADCGISMIDSPDEVLAVVLNYLGRDPRSAKREDLAAASELLLTIRPYIRKFQSQPVTDLVNGNLC